MQAILITASCIAAIATSLLVYALAVSSQTEDSIAPAKKH